MLTQDKGRLAEEKAMVYLKNHGLKLIVQNYRCRLGEIDLIMRDHRCLVFVEVRARTSIVFGNGLESVTYAKQQKIIKSASHYLSRYKEYDNYSVRFDVVSIDGHAGAITWVKDAFSVDY